MFHPPLAAIISPISRKYKERNNTASIPVFLLFMFWNQPDDDY